MKKVLALALALSACSSARAPGSAPPQPVTPPAGVYTDLASVPVGGWVTVYGIDSATASWPVTAHGAGRTVVQAPDAAPALTVDGQAVPVSVHAGRVVLATPATMAAVYADVRPGDAIYLRAGTYDGKYDTEGWNESNFVIFTAGTAAQPIAIAAYPGETVTIDNTGAASGGRPNFYMGDGAGRRGSHWTIAGLHLRAQQECVAGGGRTWDDGAADMGAQHLRVVGNGCEITDAVNNTMTGMITVQGTGGRVLGNTFADPADRVVINNNHAVYVSDGASDVEVAWNVLHDLHMGHVIQVHQDGNPFLYADVRIHHNDLRGGAVGDMRGITVSNVQDGSTVTISDNRLSSLGQDFSAIAVYRGQVTIADNWLDGVQASGALMLSGAAGGSRAVVATGNRIGVVAGTPYATLDAGSTSGDLTLDGNSYCGNGAPPAADPHGTVCP